MAAAAVQPSVLGLTLTAEALIPLVPKIKKEDVEFVSLTTYVRIGHGANAYSEKRKASVPLCNTGDHELLLRTVVDFMDACPNS